MKGVPKDEKNKIISNIKAMRVIRFALQFDTFRLMSSCDNAKDMWDRLKELYSTDVDLERSTKHSCFWSWVASKKARRES